MNYTNNPYYNNPYMQNMNYSNPYMQQPRVQEQYQQIQQQPIFNKPSMLQGKLVDNIEVVKATDIPLDGSVSYFALADGTAIVTKQIQQDGTSKTIVYRPVDDTTEADIPKFVTTSELEEKLKAIGNVNYKDDIKSLKRQIKEIQEDLTEIKDQKGE